MPKVSICIPAYKQAELLKKAIDSVIIQSFKDYEIVVTDDSPDTAIADLVLAYNFPEKIKYFKNDVTLGSPENWNESIRRASGEYIKILHHDDWFNAPDSLAKYVKLLDDNPEADFAFSATQAIVTHGENWLHEVAKEQVVQIQKHPLELFCNNIVGAPSTTIIRRNPELYFDKKLKWHVDIDQYIRQIVRNGNLVYSKEPLVVTFLADGRVSDECNGNKDVEVFESFYFMGKIASKKRLFSSSSYKKCILKLIKVCKDYHIVNVKDIRSCGYSGVIPQQVKNWLTLSNLNTKLGKMYLKFLRNI